MRPPQEADVSLLPHTHKARICRALHPHPLYVIKLLTLAENGRMSRAASCRVGWPGLDSVRDTECLSVLVRTAVLTLGVLSLALYNIKTGSISPRSQVAGA